MSPGERELYIHEHIAAIAEESFPDDAGPWRILEIAHRGEHSEVAFEEPPHPDPRASHRFKLILSFGSTLPPETVGGYEFHNQAKSWRLLFGADPMQ